MPELVNEAKLAQYLENELPDFRGPLRTEKFSGGQSNPTFKIVTADRNYVLRRQPEGKLLKSAHAVDREYRVMRALEQTDVPVPRMYLLCLDKTVIGSMFFVMEYCDGNIFWDASLPQLVAAERRAVYEQMCIVLATLHSIDPAAVGLTDFGRHGNYFARQLRRWTSQYRASETNQIPEIERLIRWLDQHIPPDDGQHALVHGDYRLDNMVFSSDATRIIALLDWELATLGHPLADLSYQCMQLRIDDIGPMKGLGGRNRPDLGIPTEEEYVSLYCERMHIDQINHWPFYMAFNFFRLAAILQGVAKRGIDGNASNKTAVSLGATVQPLAEMGCAIVA